MGGESCEQLVRIFGSLKVPRPVSVVDAVVFTLTVSLERGLPSFISSCHQRWPRL